MSEALPKRERVPAYHYTSEQSRALIETLTDASLAARTAMADVADQFFIDTATWGLALWEQQVGLDTDESLPLDVRRKAIREQLVASGNTTAEMIRQLAENLTGYPARVVVHDDYSFSLEFLGDEPGFADIDVEEVRRVVEQIKPAHLQFVISGMTWGDIESIPLTWGYFDEHPMTWEELESKFFIHPEDG